MMEEKMMFIWIFSGIFCGIGLIFLMVAWIIVSVVADKKKNCTSKAVGTVTDLVRSTADFDRSNHMKGYHPVVQYTTAKGETMSITSPVETNPPKYHVGETVHVRYDPHKPEKFYIEGDNTINIVKTVFFCVGLGLFVLGLLVGILVFMFA